MDEGNHNVSDSVQVVETSANCTEYMARTSLALAELASSVQTMVARF